MLQNVLSAAVMIGALRVKLFPYIFYFMFENTYRYTANTPIPSDWRFKGLIVSLYFLFYV